MTVELDDRSLPDLIRAWIELGDGLITKPKDTDPHKLDALARIERNGVVFVLYADELWPEFDYYPDWVGLIEHLIRDVLQDKGLDWSMLKRTGMPCYAYITGPHIGPGFGSKHLQPGLAFISAYLKYLEHGKALQTPRGTL